MQIAINKTKTATIFTIALLIASMTVLAVQAQTPEEFNLPHGGTGTPGVGGIPVLGPLPSGVTPQYTFHTIAFMSVSPNPIGVGQQILVNVWTSPGMYHAFYMQGYTVTIQKPNGDEVVVGPMNSYMGDATAWFEYVPDQPGTYKFKFDNPGTYLPAGSYVDSPTGQAFMSITGNYTLTVSIYYTPSSTDWQELTVQADMVSSWPPAPLPTEYWTRPVSPMNREWSSVLGSYPWTSAFYYPNGRVLYASNYKYTAYVQAPNTSHIVWRRQGAVGGIVGAEAGISSFQNGGGNPSIVFAGRCYQTINKPMMQLINGTYQSWPTSVWECYDLRNGKVYWDITGVAAPTNVVYELGTSEPVPGAEANNGYSVFLVAISGGRLLKYDPWTGTASLNISLPSFSSSTIYNNARIFSIQTINATANNYRLINWTMAGSSTNFTTRIASNITWPKSGLNTVDYNAGVSVQASFANSIPFSGTSDWMSWCLGNTIQSVDLHTGAILFNSTSIDTLQNLENPSVPVVDRGKIAFASVGQHWNCYDARSGKKLWESDLSAYPWGNWWAYATASYDFNESKGAIIANSYAGVYAIDWDDGHILWHYSNPSVPFEEPYGDYPFFGAVSMADGKIYTYNTEHTPSEPIARGWSTYCINATDGTLIWKVEGPMVIGGISDGYLTASNTYDGYTYVFGKGKSATTITAPDTAVAKGTTVLLKGTVMDMSPGDQGSIQNPTAGLNSPTAPGTVPCVSAASMETQMEYLYMQQPIDGIWHNLTIDGVPVALTAIKSDGTVIDIGTTTTNGYYGTFDFEWTPPDKGKYTILASFAGDDSYGSSSAATGLSVGPAVETPSAPEIPTPVDYTPLLYGIIAAVLVAIIIGIIAILVALRKR